MIVPTLLLLIAPVENPEEANAEITVHADAVGRIHGIRESTRAGRIRNDPVVSHPLLNVRAEGTFDRGLTGYGEFYLGKTESDGSLDTGELWGSTGDVFSPLEARLGHLEVPYGTQRHYRSDHADVQSNPLIGNPLVDPTDHQLGVEFLGDHNRMDWSLALTNGAGGTSLKPDRGFGSALTLSFYPAENVELTFSGYRSHHGDSGVWSDTSSLGTDNLFGPDQTANEELTGLQSNRPTPYPDSQNGFGLQPDVLTVGRDVQAWQADLNVTFGGTWRLRYGELEDDFSNLNLVSGKNGGMVRWNYWSVEGRVPLPIPGYIAGALGRLNAEKLNNQDPLANGIGKNGSLERYQLGWGYRMSRNSLVKIEYAHGREDLTEERNEYDGLSFEISLSGIPKVSAENLGKHSSGNGNH